MTPSSRAIRCVVMPTLVAASQPLEQSPLAHPLCAVPGSRSR